MEDTVSANQLTQFMQDMSEQFAALRHGVNTLKDKAARSSSPSSSDDSSSSSDEEWDSRGHTQSRANLITMEQV